MPKLSPLTADLETVVSKTLQSSNEAGFDINYTCINHLKIQQNDSPN
ncbi:hypothetical protein ACVW2L_003843 [Mucilaginibacter sp. HD30]